METKYAWEVLKKNLDKMEEYRDFIDRNIDAFEDMRNDDGFGDSFRTHCMTLSVQMTKTLASLDKLQYTVFMGVPSTARK